MAAAPLLQGRQGSHSGSALAIAATLLLLLLLLQGRRAAVSSRAGKPTTRAAWPRPPSPLLQGRRASDLSGQASRTIHLWPVTPSSPGQAGQPVKPPPTSRAGRAATRHGHHLLPPPSWRATAFSRAGKQIVFQGRQARHPYVYGLAAAAATTPPPPGQASQPRTKKCPSSRAGKPTWPWLPPLPLPPPSSSSSSPGQASRLTDFLGRSACSRYRIRRPGALRPPPGRAAVPRLACPGRAQGTPSAGGGGQPEQEKATMIDDGTNNK